MLILVVIICVYFIVYSVDRNNIKITVNKNIDSGVSSTWGGTWTALVNRNSK